MRISFRNTARCAFINALLLVAAQTAFAGAHTWDVNEVFTNADGTIQFVELREANGTAGETGVPGQTMASSTATSFAISGPALSPPTSNKFYLLGTTAFQALSGAPPVDATIPSGSVPFFGAAGATVSYGPYDSWPTGAIPTDGVNSVHRLTGQGTNSPTNYAGTSGQVNASPAPGLPAMSGLGVGLVIGLLVLAGIVVVRRSRSAAA